MSYYSDILAFLGKNMFTCPTKAYLGFECPGCGLQRSVLLLLQGQVYDSIRVYPATIPMLLMFIILILHVKFKFAYGHIILQYIFIFNAALIFTSYIIKHL
ncbi:MAG: hypothetical protein JWO03_2768 [Bacteroidetes bacterium]|nr:hypothetical protein [Bacteroidota bacterium]